mmetsp:Transcript_112093/g.203915  ORF Transcript_112093/g.203915 Transcript_112093/m.203915 type:complete len:221 (+) Transcript_112093:97-759(+)
MIVGAEAEQSNFSENFSLSGKPHLHAVLHNTCNPMTQQVHTLVLWAVLIKDLLASQIYAILKMLGYKIQKLVAAADLLKELHLSESYGGCFDCFVVAFCHELRHILQMQRLAVVLQFLQEDRPEEHSHLAHGLSNNAGSAVMLHTEKAKLSKANRVGRRLVRGISFGTLPSALFHSFILQGLLHTGQVANTFRANNTTCDLHVGTAVDQDVYLITRSALL